MPEWQCTACGGANPEGTKFCGHCGAAGGWRCEACEGENPPGMRFCGHCGQAAAEPAARAPQASSAQTDVSEALRSFVSGTVADRLTQSGGELNEERRLITALFADISGFTPLADRLDPEQLLEVIDPVVAGLSNVVGRYEGHVEKFAGDALLALFGAPVSHEDDPERALLVALEMHDELARMAGQIPHADGLTLHVGVNTGHAIARVIGTEVRMDYAVLGDSVILAQRLESAAPSGETYIGDSTWRLTRDQFEFEDVGELTLKGKAVPVRAWRLLGRRSGERSASGSALIGRERELGEIDAALGAAGAGNGAVVTVSGEPGIGKSRLTAAARTKATELGLGWIAARCLSYGAAIPYWPYLELLRDFAGVSMHDPAPAVRERLAEKLSGLSLEPALPFFEHVLGVQEDASTFGLEPEAFRRELHEAFAAWLRAQSARQPLVVVIEDVHWLDSSSAALTGELARACPEMAVVLYLTCRPAALEATTALVEAAPAQARLELVLEPLSETEIGALVEATLGGSVDGSIVSLAAERTGGNPFFAEELVRALRESGAVEESAGSWRLGSGAALAGVPPTIEGVVSARIDLLPYRASAALQAASIIGRRVRLPLLRGIHPDATDDVLGELVHHGFLDPAHEDGEDLLVFHHALAQEVAYSRLLRRRRVELHARIADVAERLYGADDDVIELLARHFYLGETGRRAFDYLVRAGERSRRLFANAEAIVHFERAAEVSDRDPAVLLQLADLHELVGSYEEAYALYEEVRQRTGEIEAWRGMAATLRKRGLYDEALRVVDEAFRRDELKGEDLRPLWLEGAWTHAVAGRFDRCVELCESGLAVAPEQRDELAAHLLLQIARAETARGNLQEAVAHARAAEEISRAREDLRGLSTALRIAGSAHTYSGDLDEAATVLQRGLELAQRVGSVEEIGGCLINLGLVELKRGRLEEAIAYDRRAIDEFERVGHGSGRVIGYGNLAEKLAQAGDYEEALRRCEQALELAHSIGHLAAIADATKTLALIALRTGEPGQAEARAREAVALFDELGAVQEAEEARSLADDARATVAEPERARG